MFVFSNLNTLSIQLANVMKNNALLFLTVLMAAIFAIIDPSMASEPLPWQKGLQPAATPVMERINEFHNMLFIVITLISVFVIGLMGFILIRFNAKANPEPSKTTHNTMIEVIWTVVPVVILILIAIPSLKLLYFQDRVENPDMTIKVVGYQWYWGYEYPDHEDLSFNAYMIADEDIDGSLDQRRLLSTDNQLVLPVDTNIQILVTAADVLHAFAVPAFGIKTDAVPGRINETWIRVEKEGTYYGQCSELCGKGHAFMPSEVRVVSKEDFNAWVEFAKDGEVSYDAYLIHKGKLASLDN